MEREPYFFLDIVLLNKLRCSRRVEEWAPGKSRVAMSITTSILSATEKSIDKLFADSNLAKEVTFKSYQGSAFVPELGFNSDTYVNYTVTGIYVEKEKLSVPAPGVMPIVATEAAFLFRHADLPEPDKRDFIQHNGTSYAIEQIKNVLNIFYRITVKGSD